MSVQIIIGDCRARMAELPVASVDSVVCDPPYHLIAGGFNLRTMRRNGDGTDHTKQANFRKGGFMGQTWDGGDVAFDPETWAEVLRVLKPGGHLVAFSGTRTYHRMAVAIEDAGFEIRDQLAWVYGSGFPKSLDVSKAIDKAAGAERTVVGIAGKSGSQRKCMAGDFAGGEYMETAPATEAAQQWQGWGTALKPSWEPICLARKPLIGSVAQNVLTHGTGALNIDECRIGTERNVPASLSKNKSPKGDWPSMMKPGTERDLDPNIGRWPANLCHDGSEEVLAGFPETAPSPTGLITQGGDHFSIGSKAKTRGTKFQGHGDEGSAARFFYCAKATTEERGEGNNHPTVKPIALMRWLCRLVTPKGGTILDPFSGSGSTLIAADAEQFNAIGCELSPEYAAIAERRIREAAGMFADVSVSPAQSEAA